MRNRPITSEAFEKMSEPEQYQTLENVIAKQGIEIAWKFVKDTYTTTGSSLGGRSHDLAHFIGGKLFIAKGLAGLPSCDPTFAFGCYHGFTESAFKNSLDELQAVSNACQQVGPVSSGPWSSCIHGIGHGVASFYNSTDLLPALTTCDRLGIGAPFCHDGVFMEFAISAPNSFYDKSNSLHPCDTIATAYQAACGRNILAAASSRFKLSPLEVANACLAAAAPFSSACIDTFGFMQAGDVKTDGRQIATRCAALAQSAATAQCTAAAAGELVFQNYPDWQRQAPTACNQLPLADQAACHARVQQTIQNYHR